MVLECRMKRERKLGLFLRAMAVSAYALCLSVLLLFLWLAVEEVLVRPLLLPSLWAVVIVFGLLPFLWTVKSLMRWRHVALRCEGQAITVYQDKTTYVTLDIVKHQVYLRLDKPSQHRKIYLSYHLSGAEQRLPLAWLSMSQCNVLYRYLMRVHQDDAPQDQVVSLDKRRCRPLFRKLWAIVLLVAGAFGIISGLLYLLQGEESLWLSYILGLCWLLIAWLSYCQQRAIVRRIPETVALTAAGMHIGESVMAWETIKAVRCDRWQYGTEANWLDIYMVDKQQKPIRVVLAVGNRSLFSDDSSNVQFEQFVQQLCRYCDQYHISFNESF